MLIRNFGAVQTALQNHNLERVLCNVTAAPSKADCAA
jgi:hypothetical protein